MTVTVEDAIATMKSSMITAFLRTSPDTGLTIDKTSTLQDALIEELFQPSVRWSVERYLEHLQERKRE